MPDDVNFVVILHAFTGLQCRTRGYIYLRSCTFQPRNRHRSLAGRFSSVCHQILWIYILHSPTFKHDLRRELPEHFEIYQAGNIPGPDSAEMDSKLLFWYDSGSFRQVFRPARPARENIRKSTDSKKKWQERGTGKHHLPTVSAKAG